MNHVELQQVEHAILADIQGSVVQTTGTTATIADFSVPVGALVEIEAQGGHTIAAEVIGFRDQRTVVYPLAPLTGVRPGHRVRLVQTCRVLPIGDALLGRVVNAHAQPIDGRPRPILTHRALLERLPPSPTERPRVDTQLATGVRTIDALLSCGRGQRMGIMAGSGIGKSVLLGMMARYTAADVNVIALIGERGREVNEFIERELGPQGMSRSVVVVATSNEPALARVQAAYAATAIAEHFRDQGRDVLLLMDSITRLAMAQREIGLAAGEPPSSRGYPPSVFELLPRIVERAGRSPRGSITAFYSVLVEGDDQHDPIADATRGLLDGHIWLSRKLASQGHYPAIDVLDSISRLMAEIVSPAQLDHARHLRRLLAAYRENDDLISIGAYRRGSNVDVDVAIEVQEAITAFLEQEISAEATLSDTTARLEQLMHQCQQARAAAETSPALVAQDPHAPPVVTPPPTGVTPAANTQ